MRNRYLLETVLRAAVVVVLGLAALALALAAKGHP